MAVMNMPEEMVVVWKQVFMMYAPSFFSVPFFGSLPHARHSDCTTERHRGKLWNNHCCQRATAHGFQSSALTL